LPARRPAKKKSRSAKVLQRTVYEGSCHCGAIEYSYATALPVHKWLVQRCQCSFCRGHGACTTADPAGKCSFASSSRSLRRYRFGLRTVDFLIARDTARWSPRYYSLDGGPPMININSLREVPRRLPAESRYTTMVNRPKSAAQGARAAGHRSADPYDND
jgi:hypothetical protein